MVYSTLGKKSFCILIAMVFAISGCMPSDVASTRQQFNSVPVGESTSGAGAGAGATTSGSASGSSSIPPKVEIRHLIEPNLSTNPNYSSGTGYAGGGSYVRKLTLPKNFAGKLYLAGINIASLADRHIKVRFKFGVGREPITIPAVVTQAPGITPQTNIHVLVMDMRSEPFRNVRLPYDLFDYNEYNNDSSPTQDNLNTGLFCRGLKVEDDPTFTGVGLCDGAQTSEECLYAYAKVLDQGLVKEIAGTSSNILVPIMPSLPQVKSVVGNSYYQDSMIQHLKKPLADSSSGPFKFSELAYPANTTDSTNLDFNSLTSYSDWTAKLINGINYYYRGPYRLVNKAEWQFKFSNLIGEKKLFMSSLPYNGPRLAVPGFDGSTVPGTKANGLSCSSDSECVSVYCDSALNKCAAPKVNGLTCSADRECSSLFCDQETLKCSVAKVHYQSYLVPLATQLNLSSGVSHLSSSTWNGVRSETTLSAPGKTLWMDGSNARANSKNGELEHIGSCNVTGSMEILAKDSNGNEYIVALSREVKLQLVRPTQHYTDTGNDVLFTNFKTCSSNASCGGNECCFNNRCWDEKLVSQCFDSSNIQGNRQIGEGCSTDMDCSSLCCNNTTGQCSPHNTLLSPSVMCSKPIGEFCIAKEWCQKVPIVTCLVVQTGTDALGNVTCRQQCYTTNEYGECKEGRCTMPFQAPVTSFDPDAPGACDEAVPAPSF